MANRSAFILLLAIIVFTTLAYGAVHQPVLALVYVAVGTLALMWALNGFRSGATRVSRSYLQLPLIAFALYGFFQAIPFGNIVEVAGVHGIQRTISLDPNATFVTSLHMAALALFFSATLVIVDSAKRIKTLVAAIAIFGFIYAFFAILQGVLSPKMIYGVYEVAIGTPYGSFVNRNNFAAVMLMCIAVPLGLLFTGAVAGDRRLIYITAIALMGVSLVLSGSRGGLVAFVTQMIFLVLMTGGRQLRGKFYLRAVLSALLVAAVIGGAFFVGGESSLTRIADSATEKDITTNRSHIWAVTVKVIAANMPFGTGLGAFGVAYTQHDTASGLERVEQAHNDYLQIVSDAGIPGVLIGALFLFFLFREVSAAVRTDNALRRGVAVGALSGVFAVLVHSIFDFVLHITAVSIMFLTLLALLSVSHFKYDDDVMDENHRRRHRKHIA